MGHFTKVASVLLSFAKTFGKKKQKQKYISEQPLEKKKKKKKG